MLFRSDLPFAVARERIALQTRDLDRFEQERADFHERVRLAYLDRATAAPERIHVINADQALDRIKKTIEEVVTSNCL